MMMIILDEFDTTKLIYLFHNYVFIVLCTLNCLVDEMCYTNKRETWTGQSNKKFERHEYFGKHCNRRDFDSYMWVTVCVHVYPQLRVFFKPPSLAEADCAAESKTYRAAVCHSAIPLKHTHTHTVGQTTSVFHWPHQTPRATLPTQHTKFC